MYSNEVKDGFMGKRVKQPELFLFELLLFW